jgi:8-oxo-dGTP pyrophosphatase MutT (NUDIX family)
MQCANCGMLGHVFRTCSHPITSFGVICHRRNDRGALQYLMVQRRDSLCFVEFVRGKYNLQNRGYIEHLFINMTREERDVIAGKDFQAIWKHLWRQDSRRSFAREYENARAKFAILCEGYWLRRPTESCMMNVDVVLQATEGRERDEPEFGFPKGRRNIHENDIQCACREFREETGISAGALVIKYDAPQGLEETFVGCNQVRYRHVYFSAHLAPRDFAPVRPDVVMTPQSKEVRCVGWYCAEDVRKKLQGNEAREELFERLHAHNVAFYSSAPAAAAPEPEAPAAAPEPEAPAAAAASTAASKAAADAGGAPIEAVREGAVDTMRDAARDVKRDAARDARECS